MTHLGSVVEEIQRAKSAEEAFLRFETALQEYGYNNAIYTLLNDHHSIGKKALHGFATSYPEDWLKFYSENSYENVDPVFYGIRQTAPFYWDDAVERQRHDPSIDAESLAVAGRMMRLGEDAGLADGIGVTFSNAIGERVGFGISRERRDGSKSIRNLADIYLICAVFHETYLSFFSVVELPHMTSRERDVLSWSAEGKSDDKIAEKLGITTHTVRFHWNNIFRKLGVRNKIQATMIAVKHKIVSPPTIGPSLL